MDTLFDKDGINVVRNFLTLQEVSDINNELDLLFSQESRNGSLYSTTVDEITKKVTLPNIAVRSVNLLELALRVRDSLKKNSKNFLNATYKLTNVSIFEEKNHIKSLPWHTDNRPGMIRSTIYLQGGGKNSGAFQYMVGSHIRDYYVKHHLSNNQVKELSEKIIDIYAPMGSLILFDSFGFHAKRICIEKRRIIMFEFQKEGLLYKTSSIPFSSINLSKTVLDNMDFFTNDASLYDHGCDVYFRNTIIITARRKFKNLLLVLRYNLRKIIG